jgi:hypothetical protein
MIGAESEACHSTALTQLDGHSQRCANPFCKLVVEIKSPRGKHGRYCSTHCRMDGYVFSGAPRRCLTKSDSSSFTRGSIGREHHLASDRH